ncbi:2-oxo-4-hydroxy-4-carboxy-5-ureidoimidazoline decarboxylase [Streptomyces abyssalis]|uniref:2-oxo-4-hydroxy-4-carboxy-5-ureidoimidazoline decarboxylase n=1 Tax=Streptomyces abyssalis TaxID=933944 RepID=UPI00099F4B38|nr:2-oxo-4-hydroxy-4-carboxy-5-ureidoimidazoline decarboxylase [Streptomyces abyssalis]
MTPSHAPSHSSAAPGLTWLNSAARSDARTALDEVCTASAWADSLLAGRPYADTAELLAASDAAMAGLTAADLAEAMSGHPPIGRPRPGDPSSAREQRGMAGAPEALKEEMLELNLAYQERFGHVFLICATGLSGEQMRDAARSRLGNSPEEERETVRTELTKINRIRLTALADTGATDPSAAPTASVSTHILDTSAGRPAAGVGVELSVRTGREAQWSAHAVSTTDADGRCKDLPALPGGTAHARLTFGVEPYLTTNTADGPEEPDGAGERGTFFPEVTVVFAVAAGEHYHVPLLLNPYGYSVYRGS